MRGNRVRMLATARANLPLTWQSPEIITGLADWLGGVGADAVVSDHEPFVPRAARRVGVPVVALSHQHILTDTLPRVPVAHVPSWAATALGIAVLAPRGASAVVVPSFFFPRRRPGSRAVLVPPILRDDVLASSPRDGDRVLVYANEGDGLGDWLRALDGVEADVYGLDPSLPAPASVRLHAPSRAGFLADLADARAVVATAGFTLLSEALHLGKPVLAVPNRGFFEQAVNALYLRRLGRGEVARRLTARRLHAFLDRADAYRRPCAGGGTEGREQAADAIESALAGARRATSSLAVAA